MSNFLSSVVTARSQNPHSSEGGFFEAVKTTIHCAQTTPGASQFYLSIPLIGLSRFAGGGRKVTGAAITVGTILGTLFSNWKEVRTAYQKGSGLTGTGVVTEGISFAGQTALMIASGFVGGPTGKLTSLLASHLVRRINYLRLPLINGGMERLTRIAIQLFVSGSGVYGFAVATHATTTGINRSLGQENAFHDFWGQVNHLFFFMGTQQLVGLAGIGKGATSIASKALRWSANTVAASIAMQTVVNPIVFGKPISSSLHDLVTNIGNESKDLALLHMGGKMLPHQISILHKEMQQWDTEIQKSLGIVFTKIHEARIENETRWLTDTTYQSGLRITAGCVAAGLAASVIPHDSTLCLPLILGTTEPTTPTRRPSVKWPDAIDVTNAWKIFKAIYESPAGEPSPTKQDFIQRMREEPPFRAWFYDCLGRVSTRTVLLVIWMGGDKLVHYKQLARLLAKEPALEAACWESIHERVPLWRELGLDPKAHFEEMTRAESELAMIRKEATERLGPEAGESSWTSELLTLNNLIGMRRIAMIIASRDAMRERVREISTDAADFDRQARTLEGMISENLAYLLLRKLDCETGKYTHPQSYHDERSQPAFEQAYEVLRQAVIRVYEAKSEGMEGLLSTAITQQMDKIKAGGWTSYDEISKARHENDVIPSLVDAGPYLISCLYLHLLRDVPFERLALERLTSSTEGELTTYREARRAKQAAVPEELFNLLVTTEFMVKFLQKARYQLSEGKITELDQIQIAALSTSAIQIIGHFNTAFESAIARRAAPAWQRYSEKNVSENYVRNEILHPLSVLRTTIGKKIEAAAPDSPDLGPLNLIDQALLSCYDRVTEITGIFSALN